jgi:hypothetical protein
MVTDKSVTRSRPSNLSERAAELLVLTGFLLRRDAKLGRPSPNLSALRMQAWELIGLLRHLDPASGATDPTKARMAAFARELEAALRGDGGFGPRRRILWLADEAVSLALSSRPSTAVSARGSSNGASAAAHG